MASTSFSTSNGLTNKIWGKAAFVDSVKPTLFGKLTGSSDQSIIQIKNELQKNPGDLVRFRLRALPTGSGVTGEALLEGTEEAASFSYDDIQIDAQRYAAKTNLLMSQQRVNFDLRSEVKDMVTEFWQENFDTIMFRALSGDTSLTFANTPVANTNFVYGGNATSTSDISSGDIMGLTAIDRCVEKAKLMSPTMRPGNFDGKKMWVLILHPYQVYNLRTNTNTGQWLDIQKAAMNGGKVSDNPIWSEALGVYHDVILVENTRVIGNTYNSTACREALFLGAQAGICAFGKGYDYEGLKWVEKMFDYEAKFGVSATCLWGIKKSVFNSADYAVIKLITAATAHTTGSEGY